VSAVWAVAAGLLVAAPPTFQVDPRLPASLEQEAARAWSQLEALTVGAGLSVPASPRPVAIRAADGLGPAQAGASRPGMILLRPEARGEAAQVALRHELAHQLLWHACPAGAEDRLFQEAFALATSGELSAWEEEPYLSLGQARSWLERAPTLDGPKARRALARLLSEVPSAGGLPPCLARRLTLCEAGTHWPAVTPGELAGVADEMGDALVVLSRHSGKVLAEEGASRVAMAFGSVLKPLLLAGAHGPLPRLVPDRSRVEWTCGPTPGGTLDAETALLRSCNGWFLDWMQAEPGAIGFGTFGAALRALGLSALPRDASEAIGLRSALTITPLGVAHAYRLMAEVRPDVTAVLRRNPAEGTLSGLEVSPELAGIAAKTGTVRDVGGRPVLGWIAAVDRDLVLVRVRAGKAPRTFAPEVVRLLERFRSPAEGEAKVQVLGLVGIERVEARCEGIGVNVSAAGVALAPADFAPLAALVRAGKAICAGGDWRLRFPGLPAGRRYAGIFERSDPPPLPATSGPPVPERARRARRGSELIFRTSRMLYVAGVLQAEDSGIRGPARVALARVVDHNLSHSRHPGRPVCDTTHCQAFLGTAVPRSEERLALRLGPLPAKDWLPFSQGGEEPWTESRTAAEVEAVLGAEAVGLRFTQGHAHYRARVSDGEAIYDEEQEVPCELVRNPLKLPSCPEQAWRQGSRVVFTGRGRGHGEGLDLEKAKRSGKDAREILRGAYGFGEGF
jgi:hypothetical protein